MVKNLRGAEFWGKFFANGWKGKEASWAGIRGSSHSRASSFLTVTQAQVGPSCRGCEGPGLGWMPGWRRVRLAASRRVL